ncbi:MAG: hypothetical protein H3C47_05685 [Candidatus Cloacimonetes bacterium]|nr:hypothetical protein [Candidatus Cloacimonadota bacterium]
MSHTYDKNIIQTEDFDLLVVCGWQRLIPSWLIEKARVAVIGAHGSAYGLIQGRGRSPQNWALLEHKPKLDVYIFRITTGIDDGPILMQQSFNYSDFDDIESSYFKSAWVLSQLLITLLRDPKPEHFAGIPQSGEAKYLPQRIPEDGGIDWNRPLFEIYNQIRALTRPYPGAFTFMGDHKIHIWQAIPFQIDVEQEFLPGQIARIFNNGAAFAVKCSDSFLLIRNYSSPTHWCPEVSLVFKSFYFRDNLQQIITRHTTNYPDLPIQEDILRKLEHHFS